jgi:cytoskeletal protein CcmA (bactofilin family)
MSIFRRDEEPRPQGSGTGHAALSAAGGERRGPAGPASNTHIATGAKITGQVNGTSDLLIDGELEGQVQLESHVTIGPEGRVRGDIKARTVRIGGRVQGNVHGVEKVEILPTGRLEGDVSAPRVVLAEGAFFKGKVEMTGQAKPGPGPGPGSGRVAPAVAPEVAATARKAEEGE